MIIDLDRGIKGLVVHHKPLTELQLKRLLLIFDEIYITPPSDNDYFLEKGAVCYSYKHYKDGIGVFSVDGFKLREDNKFVPEPNVPKDTLPIANILNYGGEGEDRIGAFEAVVMSNILPLFEKELNKSLETSLLDRFEYAQERQYLKVINYQESDFFTKNGIGLKIAYDYDAIDRRVAKALYPLLVKRTSNPGVMFVPSPPFPELHGIKLFPQVKYESSFDAKNNKLYNYDHQFFSIVAKVNKKLALCGEFNLIPIFIDQHVFNFFMHKAVKSTRNSEEGVNKEWLNNYNIPLFKLSHLLVKSSEVHISDELLKSITIPEIISYKEKCLNELYKLRKELILNLNEVITSEFDLRFTVDADDFLYRKLIPELMKYQEAKNNIFKDKFIKGAMNFSVGALTSSFGLIQGLSPTLITLLGGVSPLLSEAALQLADKVKDKKHKKYENTFAYFLNLKK
ncbi:hypothetical protein [Rufibacter psychrotolerans]|uniref:hypothetical protein n=1 Tax=Rufibacter psychrotolerans TaxID=2812556 RepID=UPI001967807A|nr:hypothetical protein [Rufibacter sp. SYSU D00308]